MKSIFAQYGGFLTAVACLASIRPVLADDFSLIRLNETFASKFGAKCLDGTPPAFWIRRGSSKSVFSVFFEGGGWCFDLESCTGRAAGYLGTSNNLDSTFSPGGFLSGNATRNPSLYTSTAVFVHYCDGASYASYVEDSVPTGNPKLANIWMRGRGNREAIISYLLEEEAMGSFENIIVSGGSAGGLAVYIGVDAVGEQIAASGSTAKVVGFPDAGFFMDVATYKNSSDFAIRHEFASADATLWQILQGNGSNARCMAAKYPGPDAWQCLMAPYLVDYIETPLFIANSMYDIWQIPNVIQVPCFPPSCDSTEMNAINSLRDAIFAAGQKLVASHPTWGIFMDSCFVHEQNVDYCSTQKLPNCRGWQSYGVPYSSSRITLQQAFDKWFLQKTQTHALDSEYYPQNPTCKFP